VFNDFIKQKNKALLKPYIVMHWVVCVCWCLFFSRI